MTDQQWQRVKNALAIALETDPSKRADILYDRLGDDPGLHAQGVDMLAAENGAPSGFMKTRGEEPLGAPPPEALAMPNLAPAADTQQAQVWGDFVLVDELGRGGFGVVYRAIERTLRREVALKLIHSSVRVAHRDSIRLEGQHLARIDHPNVVKVYGIHRNGDQLAIAMEYVRGRTLADLVATKGAFPERDAALTGAAICGALIAVHRGGLLHRDIKASNVMRTRNGRIVLMDFGAGRDLYREPGTDADLIGTPVYMAPEVLSGGHASTASDVYSLGVLLYFLLTGRYPQGPTAVVDADVAARQARTAGSLPEVRPELADLVARMLDPDSARRPLMDAALKSALTRAVPRPPRAAKREEPSTEATHTEESPSSSGDAAVTAGTSAPAVPGPTLPDRGPEPSPFTARRVAVGVLASLAGCIGLGVLSTAEFNQVLGRSGRFGAEPASIYLVVGLKSLFLPTALVLMASVVAALATLLWRVTCGLMPVRAQRLCGVLDRTRADLSGRQLLTRGTAEQCVCLAGLVAFVLVLWSYSGFLAALTTSVDDGPASVFGVLHSGLRAEKGEFRVLLIVVMMGMLASLLLTRRLPPDGSGRVAIGGVLAMTALVGLVVSGSWRVMYTRDYKVVLFGSERCYVIGEHQQELLLHCPGQPPPRNQAVPADDPRLNATGEVGSLFDAYPLVPGYVPEPES